MAPFQNSFKTLILFWCIPLWFHSAATSQNFITKGTIQLGENLTTNGPIEADLFSFPYEVNQFLYIPSKNTLFTSLRERSKNGKHYKNKGFLTTSSLAELISPWNVKHKFVPYPIYIRDGFLIKGSSNKSYVLDPATGKMLFRANNALQEFLPEQDLVIGLALSEYGQQLPILEGYQISTGKRLWGRNIKSRYGIKSTIYRDDTTVIAQASGFEVVNLNNGFGITHEAKTYRSRSGVTAAKIVGGIALGVLTGFAAVPGGNDAISGISSNVVWDSTGYYFASLEEFIHLDFDGKLIWKEPLDKKETGQMYLFLQDETLYLLNTSVGKAYSSMIPISAPTISAYDTEYGKRLYAAPLGEKGTLFYNVKIGTKAIIASTSVGLLEIDLMDGHIKNRFILNINENEKVYRINQNGLYLQMNNKMISSDSLHQGIKLLSDSFNLHKLENKTFTPLKADNSAWLKSAESNGYQMFWHRNEYLISDASGNLLARLYSSNRPKLYGDLLFFIREGSVARIDLSKLQVTLTLLQQF